MGFMEGRVQVVMGKRTQDTRTPRGGDHGEGDPEKLGAGLGNTAWGRGGETPGDAFGEGGCLGGREPWAVLVRGQILKEKEIPWRGKPKRRPHQFRPRSPCPALPPCSVSRTH